MPVQELERGYLSTPTQSAEIQPLQPFVQVDFLPNTGRPSRLEGTGFNLPLELNRLYKNYNQNLSEGKTNQEAWAISVGELEVNIRTFVVEYIQTRTVLPHVNRLEEVDGVTRMVGNNGVPVVDGITSQERQGGVKEASVKIEEFLSARIPNRVAILNSPLGHSGLFKQDGAQIRYKNNQIMVFWTDSLSKLHGLTLVTDLNEHQSRQLSLDLGVSENLLDGQTSLERVSNIVRNPALFSLAGALKNPAEYVLDKIIVLRGCADFKLEQEDETIEYRSISQTRKDIQRMDQLLDFAGEIEDRLTKLKNNLFKRAGNLNHPIIQAEIERAIEETILEITIDYLRQNPCYFTHSKNVSCAQDQRREISLLIPKEGQFMAAAAFLKTRAGCGGGKTKIVSLRGLNLGLSITGVSNGIEGGVCIDCGMVNNGHYHCPECRKTYADETNVAPEDRTPVCSCGFVFGCGGSEGSKDEKKTEDQELQKVA